MSSWVDVWHIPGRLSRSSARLTVEVFWQGMYQSRFAQKRKAPDKPQIQPRHPVARHITSLGPHGGYNQWVVQPIYTDGDLTPCRYSHLHCSSRTHRFCFCLDSSQLPGIVLRLLRRSKVLLENLKTDETSRSWREGSCIVSRLRILQAAVRDLRLF